MGFPGISCPSQPSGLRPPPASQAARQPVGQSARQAGGQRASGTHFSACPQLTLGGLGSVPMNGVRASGDHITALVTAAFPRGQFSKVQSGEMGPVSGRFELSKGILK